MYSCVLRINYTNLDIRILHTLMHQIDLCYTDSVGGYLFQTVDGKDQPITFVSNLLISPNFVGR